MEREKLRWQDCDWSNSYSNKRPTENIAFRRVKLQAKLYLRFNDGKKLSPFYIKVMELEKRLMGRNYSSESSIKRISQDLGISEQRVINILNFCTLWSYYTEI